MSTLLNEAHANLRIHLVRLRSSELKLQDGLHPNQVSSMQLVSQGYSGVQLITTAAGQSDDNPSSKTNIYTFTYAVGVRLLEAEEQQSDEENENESEESDPAIVEVQAVFDAEYFSKAELDSTVLQEFSKSNVGYHVWPYWREFVQSSASRLCLPNGVLTVPFYFVPTEQQKKESTPLLE